MSVGRRGGGAAGSAGHRSSGGGRVNVEFRLMPIPNCSQNFMWSSFFPAIVANISKHFSTQFIMMSRQFMFCWSVSHETLRGKSSESIAHLTMLSLSGISS